MAKKMYEDKSMPIADIYKSLHIPRATFYKYVREYGKLAK
jgi:ACT domain-containing protein